MRHVRFRPGGLTTNAKIFGREIEPILATVLLHFAQVIVGVSIIGTHGTHYGLALLIAYTISDALLVDIALLSIIATQELALIQTCK